APVCLLQPPDAGRAAAERRSAGGAPRAGRRALPAGQRGRHLRRHSLELQLQSQLDVVAVAGTLTFAGGPITTPPCQASGDRWPPPRRGQPPMSMPTITVCELGAATRATKKSWGLGRRERDEPRVGPRRAPGDQRGTVGHVLRDTTRRALAAGRRLWHRRRVRGTPPARAPGGRRRPRCRRREGGSPASGRRRLDRR